ncbi:MAG: ATP-binding protein [Acidimicrobiales bacterium]
MGDDLRLNLHVELLQLLLGNRLDHLSRAWQSGDGSAGGVKSVLANVGCPAEVPPVLAEEVRLTTEKIEAVKDGPLALLVDRLKLSFGEELLIAATWWAEVDAQMGSVFGVLNDDGRRRHPNGGLMYLVCRDVGIDVPIQPQRLIEASIINGEGPGNELNLTATARHILSGTFTSDATSDTVSDLASDTASGNASLSGELAQHLKDLADPLTDLVLNAGRPILLRGVAGSGRRALAATVASRLGLPLIEFERLGGEQRLIGRLGIGLPLLTTTEHQSGIGGAEIESQQREIDWANSDGPLLMLGQPEDEPTGSFVVNVPVPPSDERRTLWAKVVAELGIEDSAVADRLADQFQFTERDIADTATRARLTAAIAQTTGVSRVVSCKKSVAGSKLTGRDLWTAAQRKPDLDLQRIATRVEPAFSFADLVLTDDAAQKLDELVAHVRHQTMVFDRWGFSDRMPRGRGVAALFSGPPGTGKTTAAEAIANELSTELFRIDLSRVVSKYIGETEKNLAVAFREAERSGAILLFDEADSLFGKRTDVRDAHDRYANLEVSYLLQRVETFAGLVLLSTNKVGNIDEAFQRRLRFVIRFESPNASARQKLWQRSFPSNTDVGDLDWAALAAHDLSGGHIQTAALAAAFLAAGDGGSIQHHHLDQAIAHEYEKLNRAAPLLEVAR